MSNVPYLNHNQQYVMVLLHRWVLQISWEITQYQPNFRPGKPVEAFMTTIQFLPSSPFLHIPYFTSRIISGISPWNSTRKSCSRIWSRARPYQSWSFVWSTQRKIRFSHLCNLVICMSIFEKNVSYEKIVNAGRSHSIGKLPKMTNFFHRLIFL